MKKTETKILDRQLILYEQEDPEYLVIQVTDDYEMRKMDQEIEAIRQRTDRPFLFVCFIVADWNEELSPWPAPAVFGKEDFGAGAPDTLKEIRKLLPELRQTYGLREDIPVILAGYSLAGLFSLWAGYVCADFQAICAASPSVWFPGWIAYAQGHSPQAGKFYLSLGDKEEKTRNPVMAAVGSCIIQQEKILNEDPAVTAVLEWNEGNHFKDPDQRCARGIVWCLQELDKTEQDVFTVNDFVVK